jgi:hypothetical protein
MEWVATRQINIGAEQAAVRQNINQMQWNCGGIIGVVALLQWYILIFLYKNLCSFPWFCFMV